MNILPKKRWHVRTKENIARVRRDEALAAEQEQERLRRVALAEQEFRTSLLRKQAAERRGATCETSGGHRAQLESGQDATEKDASIVGTSGHINFFQHLEEGERVAVPNEEYLREQKEEKEKYEKSIGYLTYLGQGSREETKQKAWFETLPVNRAEERQRAGNEEVKRKAKALEDPLMVVKKLAGVERDDYRSAGLAKPALPPHLSKPTGTADRQTGGQHSSASTDERSAKKARKDSKHERQEKRRKAKKKKHSKKKNRDEPHDRRHAKKSKKSRRRSPSPSDSSSSEGSSSAEEAEVRRIRLERLRTERLQRERQERQRAERLLSDLRGQPPSPPPDRHVPPEPRLKQRYNAQFNPYLAKQNYRHS